MRLCKGAYAEPAAEAFDRPARHRPSFARCLRILMAGPGYPMVATHDPRLIAITRSLGLQPLPDAASSTRCCTGSGPDEQRRLAAAGAKVRVYVPYGGDWYPYLVRRLAERPANLALFLRSLGSNVMIAILGTGKMGEALLSGLLRAGRPAGGGGRGGARPGPGARSCGRPTASRC